jgi:hypothetical protein
MRVLLVAASLLLVSCQQSEHIRSAGEIACNNRDALRVVLEQTPDKPDWVDSVMFAFDTLCAALFPVK